MTPSGLGRVLWYLRQEALCHNRVVGLGTDELWHLIYSDDFMRLIVIGQEWPRWN